MTPAQLAKLAPGTAPFAKHLIAAATIFQIDTTLRQSHWLAQLAQESGGFTKVRESLNYSVEGLMSTFGRHRISADDAHRFGRSPAHQADQIEIANRIYGGEWGAKNLGNVEPGDGARYIGRGLKQLTGRDNYRRCSLALYRDERLIARPDLLEQPEAAALSAGWFWLYKLLAGPADLDDIVAVTKAVNGGVIGLDGRKAWLVKAKAALA